MHQLVESGMFLRAVGGCRDVLKKLLPNREALLHLERKDSTTSGRNDSGLRCQPLARALRASGEVGTLSLS